MGRTAWAAAMLATAGVGASGACAAASFICAVDGQCPTGQCVSGSCAFDDEACESGLRYGEHAADGLGGECVEPMAGTGDGTTSGGPQPVNSDESGSSRGHATTDALDGTGSSSSGPESSESTTEPGSADSSTGSAIVDPDLVAWYRCDGRGEATAQDASGYDNHGSCVDCPIATAGIDGGACSFDGSQRIDVPHDVSLEQTEFTLAAWALPTPLEPGRLYTIVAKPHGPQHFNSYEIGFNFFGNVEVALMCYGGDGDTICSSAPVQTGVWVHVAMTYDGVDGRLYLDGELVTEGASPADGIVFDESPLLIGIDDDDGRPAHPMDGLVDDIRLYRRALDDDEIVTLATP